MCLYWFLCVRQVRDGRTGSVLFQSEEKASRIRCTCLCRQPSVVVMGQEDGTVQVGISFFSFYDSAINCLAYKVAKTNSLNPKDI